MSVTMSGVVVTQNQQPRFAFYSIEELLKKSSSKSSVEHSPEHEVLDFSGPKKGWHLYSGLDFIVPALKKSKRACVDHNEMSEVNSVDCCISYGLERTLAD